MTPRSKAAAASGDGPGAGDRNSGQYVEIDGRRLRLTNLDKVLYPLAGVTKASVIDYYARVAPVVLPHLDERPVTVVRYPDGVDGPSFFEKRCPGHRPTWVRTVPLDAGSDVPACAVDDRAALVWMANLAALELHTPQARADDPEHPTAVVFDLDPGPGTTMADVARVALDLQALLADINLDAVVKTSGGKGLHLSIGIRRGVDADQTKAFARAVGGVLAARDPDRVTLNMARQLRNGRVFVDWSQNDRHKTTVCAYSLRATPDASVSTPLTWDEVALAAEDDAAGALRFGTADVLARVDTLGDLYAASLSGDQQLPSL